MDKVDQLLTDIMKTEFQERKIYTAEDMIEFAYWAASGNVSDGYRASYDNLKNWLNERSRKDQYKTYLKSAMSERDVCLHGFDEWFEKFWESTPTPL